MEDEGQEAAFRAGIAMGVTSLIVDRAMVYQGPHGRRLLLEAVCANLSRLTGDRAELASDGSPEASMLWNLRQKLER